MAISEELKKAMLSRLRLVLKAAVAQRQYTDASGGTAYISNRSDIKCESNITPSNSDMGDIQIASTIGGRPGSNPPGHYGFIGDCEALIALDYRVPAQPAAQNEIGELLKEKTPGYAQEIFTVILDEVNNDGGPKLQPLPEDQILTYSAFGTMPLQRYNMSINQNIDRNNSSVSSSQFLSVNAANLERVLAAVENLIEKEKSGMENPGNKTAGGGVEPWRHVPYTGV